MSFLVKEISDKAGMNDFLSIPSEIYRHDPNWVAPQLSEIRRVLNPSKNPYFENASLRIYVCYSDGKPVCRSILVINQLHWQRWNKKSAFFGFFESFDNIDAVRYMFERIETEGRSVGAEYLEGPFNPNHYSELGILLDNFNSAPIFFETYNPPYYVNLLKDAGFSELCKLHSRINPDISGTLKSNSKITNQISGNKVVTVRKFNIFRLRRDLEIMRDINNDAFENNWYFLPLSKEEYKFSAKYLFFVTMPKLILIAEYNGIPVGTVQCVINFNSLIKSLNGRIRIWNIPGLLMKRRTVKELVIFTVGVKKAFHNTRVLATLLRSVKEIFCDYQSLSTTWIPDENKRANFAESLGLKPYKHFVIFSKQL